MLSADERREGWLLLAPEDAEDFFLGLPSRDQTELILSLPPAQRRSWMRLLPPDDAADVVQLAPPEERDGTARPARRAHPPRGVGAPRLRRGRRRRPDEPALRAPAPGDARRRGDHLPAAPGARAARDDLLRLRARRGAAPARRGLVPRALPRAARPDGPGRSCTPTSSPRHESMDQEALAGSSPSNHSHRGAGRRRRGPHQGHRHGRRHRATWSRRRRPRTSRRSAAWRRSTRPTSRSASGGCCGSAAAGCRRSSSARCSPRPRWATSRTRSRAPSCWRCSSR